MFKPKTPITAVFASPKGSLERDGRLENSSGEWIRLPLDGKPLIVKTKNPSVWTYFF
jgi:hypothetical protein